MAHQTFIIAECAQGYSSPSVAESIDLAKWLTRSAKASGADAVKFQLIVADELACPDYKHYKLFKSLELGLQGWHKVSTLASEIGITLAFDVFGVKSLRMAESLGVKTIKIHPTDFINSRLLQQVAQSPVIRHVIAGCGGASYKEIKYTLEILASSMDVTLLLGFQGYPTLRKDNCLNRLASLRSFQDHSGTNIKLGFADHADPISNDASHIAAVSLGYGVSLLEKHLTLARCLSLEDHESALSPDEFLDFVRVIRGCEEAKGLSFDRDSKHFELPASETTYRANVSRHVISARDISAGEIIREVDVCLKRSNCNCPITDIDSIVGRKVRSAIAGNAPILLEHLEP